MRTTALWLILLFLGWFAATIAAQQMDDFTTPLPLPQGHTLIIGFPGGREKWDSNTAVRRLALKLREMRMGTVHVETIENTRRATALTLVRQALDRDRNGALREEEKRSASLILYGHSFGGAAVVKFAKQLDALGVPVRLTVQIDSVGWGDAEIPPNVRRAANLYQRNGWIIQGEAPLRAEDPAKTEILGNWEFDYSEKKIDITHVGFFKKVFRYAHTRMEYDPRVWQKVEELILEELKRPSASGKYSETRTPKLGKQSGGGQPGAVCLRFCADGW
jgi:hypothetical protein